MKRYIRSSSEQKVKQIADELYLLLQAEGNGAEVKGIKTRSTYYLWMQDSGLAIYFDDGNIWRDKSEDKEPLYFNTYEDVARWLIQN